MNNLKVFNYKMRAGAQASRGAVTPPPICTFVPPSTKYTCDSCDASITDSSAQGESPLGCDCARCCTGALSSESSTAASPATENPKNTSSLNFVSIPPEKDAAKVEVDEGVAAIENHEDSFYASLVLAQQLRAHRHPVAAAPAGYRFRRGAPTENTPSRGAPCSSHPPRTLQDLLAWRQEMLEARVKEHNLYHHTTFGSSLGGGTEMRESSPTTHPPSPLRQPSSSVWSPSGPSSPSLTTPATEECTLTPKDVQEKAKIITAANRSTPLPGGATPRASPHAKDPSSRSPPYTGMPRRAFFTPAGAEDKRKSGRQHEFASHFSLHKCETEEANTARSVVLLLVVMVLAVLYNVPFLSEIMWGLL